MSDRARQAVHDILHYTDTKAVAQEIEDLSKEIEAKPSNMSDLIKARARRLSTLSYAIYLQAVGRKPEEEINAIESALHERENATHK